MSNRNSNSFRPGVVELERRDVPTILGTPELVGRVLTIRCDTSPSTVVVAQQPGGGLRVQDVIANRVFAYGPGEVRRVDLFGGEGNDKFTSRGNGRIRVRMFGGDGNDTLYGGPGRDVVSGGNGNDVIYGRGGNDALFGGEGNDYIAGGGGNDIIAGGGGNDRIIGGSGTDAMSGNDGDDILIALDGGVTDTVDGGNGADVLWIDQNGAATDGRTGVDGFDTVHAITAFANGADRTLNGDRIPNPTTLIGDRYESYPGYPLFGPNGPRPEDIAQGTNPQTGAANLDDSWLLSAFGAVATVDPVLLQNIMVDFGDGTFGVLLDGNYYRVDSDLPTLQFGDFSPAYTLIGNDTGVWAAILEKVFTYVQSGPGQASYQSLNGTGGATPAGFPGDAFEALGYTPNTSDLSTFIDTFQIGAFIRFVVDNGFPASLAVTTPSAAATLDPDHDYTLVNYNLDNFGFVRSVVLYNPTGVDGGGSADADPNDGFVTINLTDLFGTTGSIDYGT